MNDFNALDAYAQMHYIRKVEEAIADEYPKGEMRLPVHLSIGQESTPVAVAMALKDKGLDHRVYASHRSHAPYLAFGGNLNALVAELYGLPEGCTGGMGGSMYLTDISKGFVGSFAVVGDCVSVATGGAFASSLASDGVHKPSVAFIGDAVLETGQFWESLNFAALHKLPLLYVCENNWYATQTPLWERQIDRPNLAAGIGHAFQMWTAHLEGDYPGSVYAQVSQALDNLPAFVAVDTYRFREHVGPKYDHDMGYRDKAEVDAYMVLDPLKRLERELIEQHGGNHKLKPAWVAANTAIQQAFDNLNPGIEELRIS